MNNSTGTSFAQNLLVPTLLSLTSALVSCTSDASTTEGAEGVDGGTTEANADAANQLPADAAQSDIDAVPMADASVSELVDDFERSALGDNWAIRFPLGNGAGQVHIIDDSDLGLGIGPQGFFLANWVGTQLGPDQYSVGELPQDATPDWIYMVHVRWRQSDGARYGFAYNGDPGQGTFGSWIFKYDGVASALTRIIGSAPAAEVPRPGDSLRIEVEGYTLRGYLNGALVLTATDTNATKIDDGEAGLAARWATGNQATQAPAKVWESWGGGSL